MNKLYVCIYLLPLETSSHPPSIPPLWVITEHWAELHGLYSSFLLVSYFTHGSVYVYVCMYVYVCICLYMYVYVNVNATLSLCPTLSFPLPGKFHGQRSLVGYSPWGHRIRHDWASSHSLSPSLLCPDVCSLFLCLYSCPQRRQWHPTPVLLPGKSHGWRSLVGCSPWGR